MNDAKLVPLLFFWSTARGCGWWPRETKKGDVLALGGRDYVVTVATRSDLQARLVEL